MDTKILRNLVETCPKTQKEIASDLGYSQQRFNFYVNGQREPDVDALCAIASYFGVSVDSLLGRDSTELEILTQTRLISWENLLWFKRGRA